MSYAESFKGLTFKTSLWHRLSIYRLKNIRVFDLDWTVVLYVNTVHTSVRRMASHYSILVLDSGPVGMCRYRVLRKTV